MYGPAPAAAPAGKAGAKAIALRIFYAAVPLWSLGLLAWVPALRFALLRRRVRDWLYLAGFVALTICYVLLLVLVPEDSPYAVAAGMFVLLHLVGAAAFGIFGDRFPRTSAGTAIPWRPAGPYATPPPRPAATAPAATAPSPGVPTPSAQAPPPYAAPAPSPAPQVQIPPPYTPGTAGSPRMRQVASELDELGDLLRKQDRP